MDDIDRQLLIELQREIPFQSRPFQTIGRKIGIDSADVILRLNRLQDEKVIREINAIFDIQQIDYQSVAVAMKVDAALLERAAAIVCRHPGISLCSKWQGEYNLWFLLALPAEESIEDHCQQLEHLVGAQKALILRTLKIYKPAEGRRDSKQGLTTAEIHLVRALQDDFPLTDQPFQKIAKRMGWTEEFLFQQLQGFQKSGFLKRIAASTRFREKPLNSTLVMWRIPEEKIDSVGRAVTHLPETQSCVWRSASEDLPYSLHAMFGVSASGIGGFLSGVEQEIGSWPSQCFFKEQDYKRRRLKYFAEELQDWRIQEVKKV